jgi:hypothetical protein
MNFLNPISENISNEIKPLKLRIKLRGQAIPLIRNKNRKDQYRLALLALKGEREAQMTEDFDPELSRKLDEVMVLLEE